MATIHIKNLRLRTIIGTYDWERKSKQDVILNISIGFNADKAGQSDNLKDTLDYKALTKKIIKEVEDSHYYLLEKLNKKVTDIILANPHVTKCTVKIDKPFALRFTDSVSIEMTEEK